jgi:Tol biopolymer transport system component
MRVPFDPNLQDEDQVTWNLWEYSLDTDTLRRIIVSDLTAEIGHDIMPKYLPDGRIIFSSTRQVRSQAVLLDEGKAGFSALDEDDNEFAFNLHIINPDGSGREQVTFNQSHDLDPAVMADGTVVFSRWDHNGPQNDQVNLYRMNPDGANLELLYGNESHDTGQNGETIQFMQPRQSEDGRVFSVVRPFTDTEGGGEIIAIDTPQYVENTQPLAVNIGVLNGPAQEDATINNVVTVPNTPSPGGRYFSAYPIQDGTGRMLVSVAWSRPMSTLIYRHR